MLALMSRCWTKFQIAIDSASMLKQVARVTSAPGPSQKQLDPCHPQAVLATQRLVAIPPGL